MIVGEKIRNYKHLPLENSLNQGIPSFLLKTYQILQNHHFNDIICWTKNGEGFVIKKLKQFTQKVIPMYFRHSNYTSFIRQLNMYDFHKIRQQNQENGFKNSLFKRGKKHLLKEITRKDYKKKKQKVPSNQKLSIKLIENKDQQVIKIKHESSFYQNSLNILQTIDHQMNRQQKQLANAENDVQTDQGICQILDILFQVRDMNNNWMEKVCGLGKQWQTIINTKIQGIRQQICDKKQSEGKKQQQATISTMKNMMH